MTRKVAIIGYGSIGKKHHQAFSSLGCEIAIISRRELDEEFKTYGSINSCLSDFKPDILIIANETSLHYSTLNEVISHDFSGDVLVEKPLFSKSTPINRGNTYVAYNLRQTNCLKTLKSELAKTKIFSANIYCGQYLPTWRPGTDYSKSYSASKEKGGGALRDLSHELDYSLWLFGIPDKVVSLGGKSSDLNINSDDTFNILYTSAICPSVNISINYLDHITQRFIIVHTEKGTFKLDFLNGTLSLNDNEIITNESMKDTYLNQAKALVEKTYVNLCTLNEGIEVMNLIEQAETNSINRMES